MKPLYILIVILLLSCASNYAQTDTSIQKRFNDAELNIDMAGRYLEDAAGGFNRAVLFPVLGNVLTVILAFTLEKTAEGNISPIVFVPSLLGLIGGVVSYLGATSDMSEAGYYLRKQKRK